MNAIKRCRDENDNCLLSPRFAENVVIKGFGSVNAVMLSLSR